MFGWIESLWHFAFGWPTVAVLIGAAATAVAVLEPPVVAALIPDLRKWAIVVAVVAFSFTAIAGKYYDDGLAEKQRQWDASLVKETVNGEAARDDADRTVGPMPSDRRLLRSDPFNRNSGTEPECK